MRELNSKKITGFTIFILSITLLFLIPTRFIAQTDNGTFSFVLAADMREFTGDSVEYFRGACEAISELNDIQFIISPGDIDPPDRVLYTIRKYVSEDMIWYPVVGNHESETVTDMEWLRNFNKHGNLLPNIVNSGPSSCLETTYSFDYENTHFVVLNQYCNSVCDTCTDGDISDVLYNWLEDDLRNTNKKNTIVVGHEPAYPFPDIENQRFRHESDCLNQYPENRDKFVKLLQEFNVNSYIVGHTHDYSIVKINKLWHIDVGHSRGLGDMGARSTFVKINVGADKISYETYRLNFRNNKYEIFDSGILE